MQGEPIVGTLKRFGLPDTPVTRAFLVLQDDTVSRLDQTGRILGVRIGRRDYVSNLDAARLDAFEMSQNRSITEFVDAETSRLLLETISEALESGGRVDVEYTTLATGRTLHLMGSCFPCGDNEVIWVSRDLTPEHVAHRAAQARAKLEATVSDCLQSLIDVGGIELHQVLDDVVGKVAAHFGAHSAYLRRFRGTGHVEIVCQWRARHLGIPAEGRSRAGAGVFPWAARELAKHPILVVRDVQALGVDASTDVGHRMTNSGGRALVWIRTGPPRRPTGIMGLVFADPLNDEDSELFEPLIGLAHTMLAVANRQLDEVRRGIQHRVFELIARGAPLPEVLSHVCRLRESGWPGQHCVAWLTSTDGTLRPVGAKGANILGKFADQAAPNSPEVNAAQSRRRIWVTDTESSEDALGETARRFGANAVEATPLTTREHDGMFGVLAVYDTSADPVDPEKVEPGFPALAASLATIAVERDTDLAELAHQATHDALTGLVNRSTFLDRLERSLERSTSLTAVLYCDVDRFKVINDRLGHATGDFLLRRVGERIQSVLPTSGTVARLGGDEFAILLEDLDDEDDALRRAEEIRMNVRDITVQGGQVVNLSIGVAVSASRTDHADGLLRDADMAMYQAKSSGRDRVEVFREQIRRLARDRDQLGQDLANAIETHQLSVYFQPIVDLASGRVTGFEALARWNHPEQGPVPPDVFVPVAETNGLIDALGDLVLQESLEAAAAWPGLDLHVNLSAQQLDTRGGVERLLAQVHDSPIAVERLVMEITETVLLSDSVTTSTSLGQLLDGGISLVLDDFGTGYASLTYLRRFPFRGIKIDKSFVAGLDASAEDATIVAMVLGMAASLRLEVVAEGVETHVQEQLLRDLGCARAQGFLYSPAVPAHEVPTLIEQLSI